MKTLLTVAPVPVSATAAQAHVSSVPHPHGAQASWLPVLFGLGGIAACGSMVRVMK